MGQGGDEADFMDIGFFKNLWYIIIAITMVIIVLFGLLLLGIVYSTSGIRFDPAKFGMDGLGLDE